MENKFDNKRDAEKRVTELNNDPDVYCPLARRRCCNNCVCFVKARHERVRGAYVVYGINCSNTMFLPYREVNNSY